MEREESSRQPRIVYPPHAFAIAVFASIGLCFLSNQSLFSFKAVKYLGAFFSIFGVLLCLWCKKLFSQAETEIKPFEESTAVIEKGPYRFSRNPIYLGMIAAVLGICLQMNDPLPLLAPVLFAVWIHFRFVLPEEKMMREVHGEMYQNYFARVRRWL